MTPFARFLSSFILALFAGFNTAPVNALEIQEVKSEAGVTALLVEDYTLPLISMSFSFAGGGIQDANGRDGAARLMAALLDEGAGEMDSISFRSYLEENGIELSFSGSFESVSGGLRSLAEDRENAFEMLRLALNEPRFDEEAIERIRNAIRLGIIRSKNNPQSVLRNRVRETLFSGHPYARSVRGDEASISAISRDDIVNSHKKLLARDNLLVGVVGAINAEELARLLDKAFSNLPETAELSDIPETAPVLGEEEFVELSVPSASISLIYGGIKRSDPDFFAAHLMNYILGGGSFSSRLYKEVREKRGLVYGISSGIATLDHAAYLSIGTSTRAENREETLGLIRQEVAKLADGDITQSELEDAKKYVIGSYAINNLDTSGKIARVLVALQTQELGLDYIEKRRDQIAAVTLDDVKRVARKLLAVEPTQVVVGPVTQ